MSTSAQPEMVPQTRPAWGRRVIAAYRAKAAAAVEAMTRDRGAGPQGKPPQPIRPAARDEARRGGR